MTSRMSRTGTFGYNSPNGDATLLSLTIAINVLLQRLTHNEYMYKRVVENYITSPQLLSLMHVHHTQFK